ncbi:MAG: hypothetical protein K2G90_09160, partial [Muribaculaceae bacterium]|nr:hypothetical protein [Muribaculaceae bacterium]
LYLSVWRRYRNDSRHHCPVALLSMFSLAPGFSALSRRFPFAVAKLQQDFSLRKYFYVLEHIFLIFYT